MIVGVNWHGRRYTNRLTGQEAGNVGDANCSPLQYFDYPGARMLDLNDQPEGRASVVIFGGGSYPRRLARRVRRYRSALRVAWGVGYTERGKLRPMAPDVHAGLAAQFDLYSHRDWGCDGDYVPCVSAMSEHFDREYEVEHEVAFFGHPHDCPRPVPDDLPGPTLYNDEMDLGSVIRFLASAETIVTGSYHGVYWATLLGRRVITHPYSAKFWHFKYPPIITDNWRDGMPKARRYVGVLEECREINRAFHARVAALMAEATVPA